MLQVCDPKSAPNGCSPFWAFVAPALFILLWSGGFTALKAGLADAEPITYLALRYGVVLAVLTPLFLVLRPPLPRSPVEWGHQAVIGILVQTLYFGLAYLAMRLGVSAGLQALIVSLQPLLVGILAPRLVGERVGWVQWLGLMLGIAGAGVVIVSRSEVDAASAAGILCSFGALFGMTAGTLYEKRFGVAQHPVSSNLIQYIVGFAAVLPLAWALEDMRVSWTGPMIAAPPLPRHRQLPGFGHAAACHDPQGGSLTGFGAHVPRAAGCSFDRLAADRRGHAAGGLDGHGACRRRGRLVWPAAGGTVLTQNAGAWPCTGVLRLQQGLGITTASVLVAAQHLLGFHPHHVDDPEGAGEQNSQNPGEVPHISSSI